MTARLFQEPPAWTVDAACRFADDTIFFGTRGASSLPAKRVCAGCPVRAECLEFALTNREEFGIWGGMTSKERHREIRRRRDAGNPVPTSKFAGAIHHGTREGYREHQHREGPMCDLCRDANTRWQSADRKYKRAMKAAG